jgi:hypothetical protein
MKSQNSGTEDLVLNGCVRHFQAFPGSSYFLLALPSITVDHLVPSCDMSKAKVYDVAEVIFMVKRPFMVMVPIFSSLVQVHVSPSTVPFESSNSPKLLNSR